MTIHSKKVYSLLSSIVTIWLTLQADEISAAYHERLISAEIQLRNNTSHPISLHSCTAYHGKSINRCYLIPKQEKTAREDTLVLLGEAHNKKLPAKGYFRFNYPLARKAIDLHYNFPADASSLSLELHAANNENITLPILIDSSKTELFTEKNTPHNCTLKKETRYFRAGLKKQTHYTYQCIVTLIDNLLFIPSST